MENDILDHIVDPLGMPLSKKFQRPLREIGQSDHPTTNRVVNVVVNVGYKIRDAYDLALHCDRHVRAARSGALPALAVFGNAVNDLDREVQPLPGFFKDGHDPHAMGRVVKTVLADLGENFLATMAERGMAKIVSKGDGFRKVFVQAQSPGNAASDSHDLKGVGQPGSEVVVSRRKENLGFVLQPAKSFTVKNPVHVPLKTGADETRLLWNGSTPAVF